MDGKRATRPGLVGLLLAGLLATLPAGPACADDSLLTLPLEELIAVRATPESRGIFRAGPPPANGFVIGVLVPLARFPEYSAQTIGVLEMAARAINAAGGSGGRPVDLVFADDAADAAQAEALATRLIREFHAEALIGPMNAARVVPVARKVSIPAGVPLIAPSASGEEITQLAATGPLWRLVRQDKAQGVAMGEGLADEGGLGLVYLRLPYGIDMRTNLLRVLAARGIAAPPEMTVDVRVDYAQLDLAPEFDAHFRHKPRTIVLLTNGEIAAPVVSQLAHFYGDSPLRIVAADAVFDRAYLDHVEPRLLGCTAFALPAASRRAMARIDQLMRQIGLDYAGNNLEVAYTHDTLYLLAFAEALRVRQRLPSLANAIPRVADEGTALATEHYLRSLRRIGRAGHFSFEGLSGRVRLDAAGERQAGAYRLWQRREGRLVPLSPGADPCAEQ